MEQTRRSRKRDTTHRAIMHSAKLLFEKEGIANVTIEKIAEGADVSRSTFFSHFESLEDLLSQIANEEINDIIKAADNNGSTDISAVFKQLTEDTYPYPLLTSELFVRSILSSKESSISKMLSLITGEIEKDGYSALPDVFTSKDISAFIFGAYFGLIFQKLIDNEPFENPDETNDKIQHFIKFLKNQEETKQ